MRLFVLSLLCALALARDARSLEPSSDGSPEEAPTRRIHRKDVRATTADIALELDRLETAMAAAAPSQRSARSKPQLRASSQLSFEKMQQYESSHPVASLGVGPRPVAKRSNEVSLVNLDEGADESAPSETLFIVSPDPEAIVAQSDALEVAVDTKGRSYWAAFKDKVKGALGVANSVATNRWFKVSVGVVLFTVGIMFPPASGIIAGVSLGWAAYQFGMTLKSKFAPNHDKSWRKRVIAYEFTVTVGLGVVTFLSSGLAEAVPGLIDIYNAFAYGTAFTPTLDAACMTGNVAQATALHIGSIGEWVAILKDLADCCTPKYRCTCPDYGEVTVVAQSSAGLPVGDQALPANVDDYGSVAPPDDWDDPVQIDAYLEELHRLNPGSHFSVV